MRADGGIFRARNLVWNFGPEHAGKRGIGADRRECGRGGRRISRAVRRADISAEKPNPDRKQPKSPRA